MKRAWLVLFFMPSIVRGANQIIDSQSSNIFSYTLPSVSIGARPQENVIDVGTLKGMITNYDPINLNPEFVTDAQNVDFDRDLGAIKRFGYQKENAVSLGTQPINGLFQYITPSGNEYLMAIASNSLSYSVGSATFTTVISTIEPTVQTDCVSAFGRFTCTNSSQAFYLASTTRTVDVPALFPLGSIIVKHVNRLWIAGVPSAKSTLYTCRHLDPDTWDLGGNATDPAQFTIGANDGDEIMALYSFNDVLYIFKRRSMWALYGKSQNDFTLTNISNYTGCIQKKSIRDKQGRLFWLSHRGIEKLEGGQIILVSDVIKNLTDNVLNGFGATFLKSITDTTQGDFQTGISSYVSFDNPINSLTMLNPSTKTIDTFTNYETQNNGKDSDVSTLAQSFIFRFPSSSNLINFKIPIFRAKNFGEESAVARQLNITLRQSDVNFSTKPSGVALSTITKNASQLVGSDIPPTFVPNNSVFVGDMITVDFSSSLISLTPNVTYWIVFESTHHGDIFEISFSSITDPYIDGYRYGKNFNTNVETIYNQDYLFRILFSSAQFSSKVNDLGGNVNKFSTFKANSNANGGKINFFVRANTSEASTLTSSWLSQVEGTTIATTANRFIQYRTDFGITKETQTPVVQDVSIEYFDNVNKQNLASWVYNDKYMLACSTDIRLDYNNIVLVIDRFDNFTKYKGINALSFAEAFGNKLYFGSSLSSGAGTGFVYRFNTSFADDPSPIESYIVTKDYCGNNCDNDKFFSRTYIKTRNDGSLGGTLSTNYQYNRDDMYNAFGDISLTEGNGVIVSKINFPFNSAGVRGKTIRFKYGNNQASHDFRFYGSKTYYSNFPVE